MRKVIGSAVLVAVIMAAGSPAAAQQKIEFGIGAGLTLPTGDYNDGAGTGFHGTGAVLFGLGTGPLAVRVDLSYHRTGLDEDVDGNTSLLGGMASLVYNVPSTGQVKPYLLAGLGYYQVKLDVTGVLEADESNLAWGGGAGLALALRSATLFAEVRYNSVTEGDTFTATNFIPITVGIRFGGR